MLALRRQESRSLPIAEVGVPHIANQSALDQMIKRASRLLEGRQGIRNVELQQINVIGSQSFEAGLGCCDDMTLG